MKTIVVAYDDTPPSKKALERTATLAEAFGSKVYVVSIASLTHSGPKAAQSLTHGSSVGEREEDVREGQQFLSERGIDAEAVSASGDPATAIARLAEQRGADLVVIGSRELGPAQRLLGQSVSQAVSRRVHCDLLIVHPDHN
jgi:nucleotide-binding universal stress UspA family protein